ncbi:hypothetical protein Hanom_Chr13g01190561 [Helianthus anomalus]
MKRRVNVCLAAKSNLKYGMKRGCYMDENANPLDFVKIFCAGTYKLEAEKVPKFEESVKIGSSISESACSKCDKSEADKVKLLKDAESLTLEIKNLKDEKKSGDKQILEMREVCEKVKSENVKLLSDLNSLTLENKIIKEKEKDFESKIKSLESDDFWIKLENKNLKENEANFKVK